MRQAKEIVDRICKEFADQGKLIEAGWQSYRLAVLDPDAPLRRVERAEIWQGGMMVACVEGPSRKAIECDVCRYAVQYAQDGPVSIRYSMKARPDGR